MTRLLFVGAFASAIVSMSGTVFACDEVPDSGIPEGSIATKLPRGMADLGGVRSALGQRGILVGANYIGEVFGNSSGGVKQDTYYDGRLELYADVDLQKMAGWKGACFHINGYQIHGTSITAENLGSLMPVSYIEATPATRLFELYLEQDFFNKAVSIRFGQLAADSEFLLSDGGGFFINGTWGWPSITAADLPSGGPAYPLATPGVRVQVKPSDDLTLRVAVFNGDPVGPCDGDPQRCNDHGLEFRVKDPPLLMAEGSYEYNKSGLRGRVTVGGWNHFGDFEDLRFDSGGGLIAVTGNPARIIDGDYGIYGIIDQLIYRVPGDDPKGISLFARVIGAPEDRNLVDFYAEGGFTFTGMIPHRPDDAFAIGFAYTGISDNAAGFAADAGDTVILNHESVLEIVYTAQIAEGWTLQPDFQYFWNPGGNVPDENGKAVGDAAVFGLRTSLSY